MNSRIQLNRSVKYLAIALFSMLLPLVSQASNVELVQNGDFSLGDTLFYSDYVFSSFNLIPEGNYTIIKHPHDIYDSLAMCSDHTGNGLMMVVNGSYIVDRIVWGQDIKNISPNHEYTFSFWSTTAIKYAPPFFSVIINNQEVTNAYFNISSDTCNWTQCTIVWNSGNSNSASIHIIDRNQQGPGNDFCLDDISFKSNCTLNADAGKDTVLCDANTLYLGGIITGGAEPMTYNWQPTTGLDNPNSAHPFCTINQETKYFLTVTDQYDCTSYDSITVIPVVTAPSEITTNRDTIICPCESVTLSAYYNPIYDYLWSNGDTNSHITVNTPGLYSCTISYKGYCPVIAQKQVSLKDNSIEITIQSDTIKAGDTVRIPVKISNPAVTECSYGNYSAKIKYNKTMLFPIGNTPFGTINGDYEEIQLSGTQSGNLIKELEFISTLGDSECTDVFLDISWDCSIIEDTIIQGTFCTKGICHEPESRLFQDTPLLSLSSISPNPTSGKIEISLSLLDNSGAELNLYNSIGEKIELISNDLTRAGEYSLVYDASPLQDGLYYIVLKTPYSVLIRKFSVVK